MIGEIPLRPTPVEIQWLGTAALRFEWEQDGWCSQPRFEQAASGKAAGNTIQERTREVQVQDIQPVAEEDQAAKAMMKLWVGRVASGLEGGIENTQGSSFAEPEPESGPEAAGGDGIVWEGKRAKGEEEVAVEEDNLIGSGDIRCVSDKTGVGAHGEEAPSEVFPEEDGCEKAGCTRAGQGGRVEMEEAGRVDVRRDTRWGRHSRSEHGDLEGKKGRSRGGECKDLSRKITSRDKLTCGECVGGMLIDVEPERGRLWD